MRRRIFTGLAAVAAVLNEVCYDAAIFFNRCQGRLLELADGRPRFPAR